MNILYIILKHMRKSPIENDKCVTRKEKHISPLTLLWLGTPSRTMISSQLATRNSQLTTRNLQLTDINSQLTEIN